MSTQFVTYECLRCHINNLVSTDQKYFWCTNCHLKMMTPAKKGMEIAMPPGVMGPTCSTKLIDVIVYMPYATEKIKVEWSLDTTCWPIVGCNAHQFKIELNNESGKNMGTWFADGDMRIYIISVRSGWTVTDAWTIVFTVRERVFIWYKCDSRTIPVDVLTQGEPEPDPQKPPPKEGVNWEKMALYAGVGVSATVIGAVAVKELIKKKA